MILQVQYGDSKVKKIIIDKNGPYIISGDIPLTVEIISNNKDGFSWDWNRLIRGISRVWPRALTSPMNMPQSWNALPATVFTPSPHSFLGWTATVQAPRSVRWSKSVPGRPGCRCSASSLLIPRHLFTTSSLLRAG